MKPLIAIGTDMTTGPDGREQVYTYLPYVESVLRAGGIPLLLPPQPENVEEMLGRVDGLILIGGDDCDPELYDEPRHPACATMDARRQRHDVLLAREARRAGIPTLGICLGAQVMAIAAGGRLVQDIPTQVEKPLMHAREGDERSSHSITVDRHSHLGSILDAEEIEVNSAHHQSVRVAGAGIAITAVASDGVIEAIEDLSHPFFIGVQWHPEEMSGDSTERLFTALVEAAKRSRETRSMTKQGY